jgi:hypothetical protein
VEVVALLGPIAGAALSVGIDNEHITAGRCSHACKVGGQRRFPGATFFPEYCDDHMIAKKKIYLDNKIIR